MFFSNKYATLHPEIASYIQFVLFTNVFLLIVAPYQQVLIGRNQKGVHFKMAEHEREMERKRERETEIKQLTNVWAAKAKKANYNHYDNE